LHHLFDLGRDDVRVSFWAGRREFRGAEPPPRLLKWSNVRRVREERWRVGVVSEAVSDSQQRSIVQALLAASPLTDLLEPLRLDPSIELKPLARWLRHAEVARAVADRWLTLGFAQVAPLINVALLALYHDKDAADEVRIWTRFVCHLHLLRWALFPPGAGAVVEAQALAAAQPNVKDFFGLFAAAQRLGLGRPSDLERDRRVTDSIDRWAATCVTICGPARVAELEALLARAAHLRRDREWREGTA
jgi:hypothetical protein